MGISGGAPCGRAKVKHLVTRTGVAGVALLATAGLAVAGCASSKPSTSASSCSGKQGAAGASSSAPTGSASQGVAAAWTLPNANMQSTRDVASAISASDVAHLGVAWCVPIESTGLAKSAGITDGYSTTPVVVNGVVYTQDIESNVMAIKLATGKVLWTHNYSSDNGGPDGVNVAGGVVYTATNHAAVALSAATGKQLWSRTLIGNNHEGIDMAPGYRDGTVYVSTVPVNPTVGEYLGGGKGILWALNAKTGAPEWSFDQVQNLWGDPAVNSGGGLWEPPSFDAQGNIYMGVANPGPIFEDGWPSGYPLATSRPGPNLYTDSVVKLSPTGKLLWYYQLTPHDLYDWDLQNSPVLTTAGGQPVVIDGGKAGILIELNAQTGKLLWKLPVGVHTGHDNDGLLTENLTPTSRNPLPAKYTLEPGALGGIETPLASNGSVVYAAVNDVPFSMTNIAPAESGKTFAASITKGTGEMVAVNQDTGKIIWDDKLPSSPYGAATVTNNVVFTTTYSGYLYAFNAATGAMLLKTPLSSGSNAPVAVDGDYVLVGAGVPTQSKSEKQLIIAYKLGATGKLPDTVGRS
jgi:alcohol dehydrogenase (cytochrome c)